MSIGYRPEIDGLRAVAVLGVLIYHAELTLGGSRLLPAGFLGVDVFFVISGFLITRILYTEVLEKRFGFLNFYERRARRILPVLFVVMLCTAPFAWWLMLPPAMIDYAGSVFTSVLYSSNFWFWSSDSYWGQASALKPLLHTWSLSLEEQFYFIAPWLVVLFARRKDVFVVTLSILLIASFMTAEAWSRTSPESAFYLLPARAWELLIGSLVAIYSLRVSATESTVEHRMSVIWWSGFWVKELLSIVALLMVVIPIAVFDSSIRHPSVYTLLPVLGAATILIASEHTLVGKLLALKPMVWLGLLSYSIYLWHFPLFAFVKIALVEMTLFGKFLCIMLSVALAFVSYWLVEKPFRNPKIITARMLLVSLGLVASVMLAVSTWAYVSKGLPNRFDDYDNVLTYLDYPYKESFLSHQCFLHPEDLKAKTGFVNCPYKKLSVEGRPTLYLWGDSNAAHLIPGIRRSFDTSHNLVLRTISGCGVFMTEVKPTRPGCKDINAESIEQIVETKPDILLIAGLWKPEFVDRLRLTLLLLKSRGVDNILVVGPVPQWTPSLPAAILNDRNSDKSTRLFPQYLTDRAQPSIKNIDRRMNQMVNDLGFRFYSPLTQLCSEKGCLTNVNGALTQWDYGHLTDEGSYEVIDSLKKWLK